MRNIKFGINKDKHPCQVTDCTCPDYQPNGAAFGICLREGCGHRDVDHEITSFTKVCTQYASGLIPARTGFSEPRFFDVLLDIGLTLAAGYLLGDPGGLDNVELGAISSQLDQISAQLDGMNQKLDQIIDQLKALQVSMDKSKVETYVSLSQSRIGTLQGYMKNTSTFIPSSVLDSAASLMDSIYVLIGDSSNPHFSALLQTVAAYSTWVQSYMAVVRSVSSASTMETVWDHPHHQFYSSFTLQTVKEMMQFRDQCVSQRKDLAQWKQLDVVYEFNGSFDESGTPFKMEYESNEGRLYLYANVQETIHPPGHPPITILFFGTTIQRQNGKWGWTPLYPVSNNQQYKAAYAAMQVITNSIGQLDSALNQLTGIDALNGKLQNEVFKKPSNWNTPPQPPHPKRSK